MGLASQQAVVSSSLAGGARLSSKKWTGLLNIIMEADFVNRSYANLEDQYSSLR